MCVLIDCMQYLFDMDNSGIIGIIIVCGFAMMFCYYFAVIDYIVIVCEYMYIVSDGFWGKLILYTNSSTYSALSNFCDNQFVDWR